MGRLTRGARCNSSASGSGMAVELAVLPNETSRSKTPGGPLNPVRKATQSGHRVGDLE
jgi:hypothetical protein